MQNLKFTSTLNATDADIEEIRDGLRAHNLPFLENVMDSDIAVYVADQGGKKVGGAVGRLFGKWLMIRFVWVDPKYKGKQLGSQLMNQLEALARDNGAEHAHLETFSFQAKDFYLKLGYELKLTLEDYPVDTQLHVMTKSFS